MRRVMVVSAAALALSVLPAVGAHAADDDHAMRTGGPVSERQAAMLALVERSCGGETAADGTVAAAITDRITNSRMGGRINAYQVSCARAIVQQVRVRGLAERAAVIAVTTAMAETTLRNYDGGDRDSVGLFQQRPSQGWGDPEDLLKPAYATNRFLDAMLREYSGGRWMTADIGDICQEVQVSAVPDAYDDEVRNATVVVEALWTPPNAVPLKRVGVVSNGIALVKEGGLSTEWKQQYAGVKQVEVAGDRIGVLTEGGEFRVKEGGLAATWKVEHTGVKQIALDGDRIGALLTDGRALVKEGGLSTLWKQQYTGVEQLDLAGDRIGVLTGDGTYLVKQGGLSALWKTQNTGVRQIALDGNRIGAVMTDGRALVKEGELGALWTTVYSGVEQLALAGDRIGIRGADGMYRVKEGGLSALWTWMYTGVTDIELAGERIGAITDDGQAIVKEGALGNAWKPMYDAVSELALS